MTNDDETVSTTASHSSSVRNDGDIIDFEVEVYCFMGPEEDRMMVLPPSIENPDEAAKNLLGFHREDDDREFHFRLFGNIHLKMFGWEQSTHRLYFLLFACFGYHLLSC